MDVAQIVITASVTITSVLFTALVAACFMGFRWLHTDNRDLRKHVDARFAEQAKTTNARFNSMDARFDSVDARFDRLEGRFDRLEEKFDTFEGRFDRLEAMVRDILVALARPSVEAQAPTNPMRPQAPEPGTPLEPPEAASA